MIANSDANFPSDDSKPSMTVLQQLYGAMPAAMLQELREHTRAYLANESNRGQYDRAQGYSEHALTERSRTLLEEYVSDQERKWAEMGPMVERSLGRTPRQILIVGSSIGPSVATLSYRYPDADILGCEVEPEAVRVAQTLLAMRPRCRFAIEPIETLNAPPRTFDLVECTNVLEHVTSPVAAIKRMAELMEPGGLLLFTCPNYLFPREPHANCWRLPGAPRALLKLQLTLMGKDSGFVDHLQLKVNTIRVKRWLSASGVTEIIDLNESKIHSILLGDSNGKAAPRLVGAIKRLRLERLVALLLNYVPMTPSVLLLAKKPLTHS
jgi:2-polyprenyl-3-methyl-5-hydroxy-6-metoxy-1,4-benzoquinol methylase